MVAENARPQTLVGAVRHFTPEVARAYVESIAWPHGPVCPKCGSLNVGTIKGREARQCREKGCRKQFSLIQGTIMAGSHLTLEQWMVGIWMLVSCRNGVSSCEIARTLGIKQQSAWHLLHRVRHVLQQENGRQFAGMVESDETFVGGLAKFMHEKKRRKLKWYGDHGKAVVHAIKERSSGSVRAMVVPHVNGPNLCDNIIRNVAPGATVNTDASATYRFLPHAGYRHEWVNHRVEYVIGDCHVNGLENFFACLRRSLKGCYVSVDPEHLGAYVDEQVYRFNVRRLDEWERFDGAVRLIVGKRLKYSTLTGGATR